MPGMELNFRCPCGFKREGVMVGATLEGHYDVVMCHQCHLLLSVWRDGAMYKGQRAPPTCRKCGKPLMPITAPGAWGPPDLQNRFPDLEPRIVEDGDYFDEGPTDEERSQLAQIRVLCPKCGALSLEYKTVAHWD
jgi:NAD-dependent SIR2 family protein deacetylase